MFVHRKNTILSKKNRIEKYIHKKKRNKKVIKKRELVVHIQIEYEYMYIDQYILVDEKLIKSQLAKKYIIYYGCKSVKLVDAIQKVFLYQKQIIILNEVGVTIPVEESLLLPLYEDYSIDFM